MELDVERVAAKRLRDPHGRQSSDELSRVVAREQFEEVLDALSQREADPVVMELIDALLFAAQNGVLG